MANFPRVNPVGWALNEQLTSAQVNQLDIDHTKAPNFDDGSSHAPLGDVELTGPNGLKLMGTQRLLYQNRSITRVQPLVPSIDGVSFPQWMFSGPLLMDTGPVIPQAVVGLRLPRLPHGGALTHYSVWFRGAAGHAVDPVDGAGGIVMPEVRLFSLAVSTNTQVTEDGPRSDTVVVRADYEDVHRIGNPAAISIPLDLENKEYFLSFVAEGGVDYILGGTIIGVSTTCLVTEQDEY